MSFDLNGGNIEADESDVEVQVEYGDNILAEAPTPVLTGSTLVGWSYDEAGLEAVGESDTMGYHDITVYAIWELDEE